MTATPIARLVFVAMTVLSAIVVGQPVQPATKPAAVIDVWPVGKMPGVATTQPEADRPPRADGARRINHISRPTLTLFAAPKADRASPAAIVCPGGGYGGVSYSKEGTDVATWLNSVGITGIVLKYRVPDNREGALQDLQRSIRLVRANADAWHIDPNRLGVVGFSAGGHLAARVSTRFDERAYENVDDVDTQNYRPDFAVLVYPAYLDDKDGKLSAEVEPNADAPPMLIVHSEDDTKFVRGSLVFKAALDEAGTPSQLLLYKTGGHGFGLRSSKDARAWPQAALDWLHQARVLQPR